MSFYYQKKHGHCGDMKKEVKCEIELKEDCKKDKRKGKMAVDFEYFVNDPNVFTGTTPVALPATETTIAALSFDDVQKKSKVLLQALVHLIGTDAAETVIIRIRKFENGTQILPASGELIYETPAITLADGVATQVAALHVDNDFAYCEDKISYLLTVTPSAATATLAVPLTFTGTEFN